MRLSEDKLLKINFDKIIYIYALILSAIDLSIIVVWFIPFGLHIQNTLYIIMHLIFYIFMMIYSIEFIISIIIVFRNKIFCIKNIIPQMILSLIYLFISMMSLFNELDRRIFLYVTILPFLITGISLFFSHMLITNYVKNDDISIFWKIVSSVNSFIILFTISLMAGSSI
jgi:hypothetical protein